MGQIFRTARAVEFADTDAAGIVHFARYMTFMETAEHQFLHSLGADVMFEHEGNRIGLPRVSASCDYKRPLFYKDKIEIQVRVLRIGTKSVRYGFRFVRDGEETAAGSIVCACCLINPDEPMRSIELPAFFKELIGPYLHDDAAP